MYSQTEVNGIDSDLDFFPSNLPNLNDTSRNICEGIIEERECMEILKEMKLNKSPGNDGLSAEFYITFWPVIGDLVLASFNEAFKKGELAASQRQAVITLLQKEGKDANYIKNYRPISLLNVDYKLLSKILSKRLQKVLHEIIAPDQLGYVKNRNIGEAIRIIDDMIFHTTSHKLKAFLVAIDFEKAFDSVSHSFLHKVLKSFGFGPLFCKWVNILYNNAQSCVMNGGISTGYFDIGRGVRQGDPLSPYLFILYIEILAHMIRNNQQVKGISFGQTEVKQVLYADDITLFLSDRNSIKEIELIFDGFYKISGLRLNKDKTFILPLGSMLSNDTFTLGKKVEVVKILGIYFSLRIDIKEEMNYKEILSKIKLLTWWKQRDLTLLGKIQLMKVYGYSKLIYMSSLLPVPEWVFTEIEKMCFDFLWRGKDKIKRNIMVLDYEQGGLKMMNFRSFVKAQRIMWIKRLVTGTQATKWKQYFKFLMRPMGGNLIFYCNYWKDTVDILLPTFYQDLLCAWIDMKNYIKVEERYRGNEIIFNNEFIQIEDHTVFNENMFLKNVYRLHHICDEDGSLKPEAYFKLMGLNEEDI